MQNFKMKLIGEKSENSVRKDKKEEIKQNLKCCMLYKTNKINIKVKNYLKSIKIFLNNKNL